VSTSTYLQNSEVVLAAWAKVVEIAGPAQYASCGRYVIRFAIGQLYTTRAHVQRAGQVIT